MAMTLCLSIFIQVVNVDCDLTVYDCIIRQSGKHCGAASASFS